MRRAVLVLWVVAAAAVPLGAQQQQSADRDAVQVRRAGLPAGWTIRLDDKDRRSTGDPRFEIMGAGYHVTSGPAAVYYRDVHRPTGSFTVRASLTQMRRSAHAEAYGLFVGGRALETPMQEYLYFLVRGDGKFLVAHRAGAEVHQLLPWTDHIAVRKEDASGKQSNELAIQVTADSVHMMINAHRVQSFARADLHGFGTDGQAGLRVNQSLDVHVGTFEIRND